MIFMKDFNCCATYLTPDDDFVLWQLGNTLVVLKDFSRAERYLHKAYEKDTTNVTTLLDPSELMIMTGGEKQANDLLNDSRMASFRKGLFHDPILLLMRSAVSFRSITLFTKNSMMGICSGSVSELTGA